MDVGLTNDQVLLRNTARRFIDDVCPLGVVRQRAGSRTPTDPDYARHAAELGWFSLLVDEGAGGGSVSGDGGVDAAVVAMERGRALQPGPFVAVNAIGRVLARAERDSLPFAVVTDLLAGDATASWAVADEHGRFDGPLGVDARRHGDVYVLNGRKTLVVDGDLVEWLLVTAGDGGGVIQVLLRSDAPGLTFESVEFLDITRRVATVRFDAVTAPTSSVVGEPGRAGGDVREQLQIAAMLTVAVSVGAMDALFTLALDYAKSRIAFGRPIGSFQAIKHSLADTSVRLESSKAVAAAAARAVSRRGPRVGEIVSMAKAYVGDASAELAQSCFQVFGGIGFTWEHDNHLYLRRLTADTSMYGDPAWHRELIWKEHAGEFDV
jgi:alkylation response protein AidB-like acyl-CoA dehydrogenase